MAEKVMELPTLEDSDYVMLFGPTPRQLPLLQALENGRLVVGSTGGITLVLQAYGDQTAEAAPVPSVTETPAPETPAELGLVSVREVVRLDLLTGPANTSSRLLPGGETLIHAKSNTFCAFTLAGEEQWCVEVIEHIGSSSGSVRIDPETIALSPDGR